MPFLPWAARDLYLAMRRQQGYAAAEAFRSTLGRKASAGLVGYVLPTATFAGVRRRFSIYAELADILPECERAIVHAVLRERIEAERLRSVVAKMDSEETNNPRRQAEGYPLEIAT